jgi:hypothetical protein
MLARALEPCMAVSGFRFERYPVGFQSQDFAYRVISLECGTPVVPFGASATAIARGDFAQRCEITVSAVKRTLKAKVRQLLLDVAVAHYRRFLIAHPDAAQGPYQRIDFHFDETDGRIFGPNPPRSGVRPSPGPRATAHNTASS